MASGRKGLPQCEVKRLALRFTWCCAAICPELGVDRKCLAQGQNGAIDPTETLVVHRGNGFDAGFRP